MSRRDWLPSVAMRVLVADDEEDLVRAISRGLRRDGYAVDEALNGVPELVRQALG